MTAVLRGRLAGLEPRIVDYSGRLFMPREPETAAGLRKLARWLAAEHGIRAEAQHAEEVGGRYRFLARDPCILRELHRNQG